MLMDTLAHFIGGVRSKATNAIRYNTSKFGFEVTYKNKIGKIGYKLYNLLTNVKPKNKTIPDTMGMMKSMHISYKYKGTEKFKRD